MAIELAMVRFVGAGLSMWATGLGITVPNGAISNGLRLIDGLSSTRAQETTDLLANMTSRIWADLRQTSVSMEDAERCISDLPEILDVVRLDPELLRSAIAQAEAGMFEDGDVSDVARHLSAELASKFRTTAYSQDPRFQSLLSFVLLEWLFAGLLDNHDRIAVLIPAMSQMFSPSSKDTYIEHGNGSTDAEPLVSADESNGLSEVIARLSEDSGLDGKAIAELIRLGGYDRSRLSTIPSELKAQVESCCAFIDQLNSVGDTMAMDNALCDVLNSAATAMACGNFSEVADRLKKAEHGAAARLPRSKGNQTRLPLEQTYELLALKTMRAKYYEIVRSWRNAAVHYQAASSLLPDNVRYERWRLMTKCAQALGRYGATDNDTDALIEATQIYAEAGGLLSEQDNPMEWAAVHLDVGRVLMLIGKREGRPARFLAAALHFKPAADVLLRASAHTEWAKAELALAQALKAQGEVQGDVVTLTDAVSCFRKAMGIVTRDRDLEVWAEAQCGLGATLQRICEETDDLSKLPAAIEALELVLKLSTTVSRRFVAEAEAAMARAKIQLAFASSDMSHLEAAIDLLKSARAAMSVDVSTTELADIECNLGLAIWSLNATGDRDTADLRMAVAVFESALTRYEAQGDEMNIEAVRERISELNDLMVHESLPAA